MKVAVWRWKRKVEVGRKKMKGKVEEDEGGDEAFVQIKCPKKINT